MSKSKLTQQQKLGVVFARLTHDFEFFVSIIQLPMKQFKDPPNDLIVKGNIKLAKHQKELIEYINLYNEGTVVKCRQVGVTTVLVLHCLWEVLYQSNKNILYLFDKASKAKIFIHTLMDVYYAIPAPLRPKAKFALSGIIRCESTKSRMQIEPATLGSGRSDSYTRVFCDEFDVCDEQVQLAVDTGIVSSCPTGRLFLSTPRREGGLYHKKVLMAEKEGNLYKRDFWDVAEDGWFGSMDNAKEWYKTLTYKKTSAQINRELLCKFRGAAEATILTIEPEMIEVCYAKRGAVIFSLDLGWLDDTAVLFARLTGKGVHIYDEYIANSTKLYDIAQEIKRRTHEDRLIYGIADSSSKKYDITSGLAAWSELRGLLGVNVYTRKTEKMDTLHILQSALFRGTIKIDPRCEKLMEVVNNYSWKNQNEGQFPHDSYSHIYDALAYLALNYQLINQNQNNKPRIYGNINF